jgi:hypothetical protein
MQYPITRVRDFEPVEGSGRGEEGRAREERGRDMKTV